MYVEFAGVQDQDLYEDIDDRQSTVALLDSIRINIKRLRKRNILKSDLYSYLIDLIEEDAKIADEDVRILSIRKNAADFISRSFAQPLNISSHLFSFVTS
jgi:hypothetical protein